MSTNNQKNSSKDSSCSCPDKKKNHNFAKCLKKQLINRAEREIFQHNKSQITIKNIWRQKTLSITVMAFSSLLFTLGVIFFLGQARALPTGVSAIPSLIIIILNSHYTTDIRWGFSLLYLGINIPLMIFMFIKIPNRTFSYLTFLWLVFQVFWNQIFLLDTPLKTFLVNNISVKDPGDSWSLFYYTIVGAILSGWSTGIAWKFGGSCGGTDYITYFITLKYRKPIEKVMFSISIFFGIFSLGVLYFVQPVEVDNQIFGPKLLAVFVYLIVSSLIVGRIYPKYGKTLLQIYTNDPDKIVAHLRSIKYWHSYNIWEGWSGYTNQKQWRVETIIFTIEQKAILEEIVRANVNFWYSATRILQTTDRFDTTKIN
ncbi:YitT family protein [Mycoplasma sp. 'Moose RK']|uniref:YitT family protein n=1 Tax=Mycoplasma sp. 'Moose RK' TaxID=2780095 RepID=UPI0018C1CF58|nr:YitT family protein [Mycoplasma sp. 'Moose RK']MBG0730969.1 YitT family protein [Mycoplasma sp. 'Moose RK']